MKVLIDFKDLAETLDRLEESELCPSSLSLKDSDLCSTISCRDCWVDALEEAKVNDEE